MGRSRQYMSQGVMQQVVKHKMEEGKKGKKGRKKNKRKKIEPASNQVLTASLPGVLETQENQV